MLLPPQRRTLHRSCKEVEHRPNGTAVTVYVQFLPVSVSPFLLLRSRHANPQQIRLRIVDGIYYRPVVLVRKFRLIGWGIRLPSPNPLYAPSVETSPHAITILAPSGISTSPLVRASANRASFILNNSIIIFYKQNHFFYRNKHFR